MPLLRRGFQRLQPFLSPRGDHTRRRVPARLNRSRQLHPPALALPRERLLPLHRLGDEPRVAGAVDFSRTQIQSLLFCPRDGSRSDLFLRETSPGAAVELR